jgi:hypothetical protein
MRPFYFKVDGGETIESSPFERTLRTEGCCGGGGCRAGFRMPIVKSTIVAAVAAVADGMVLPLPHIVSVYVENDPSNVEIVENVENGNREFFYHFAAFRFFRAHLSRAATKATKTNI